MNIKSFLFVLFLNGSFLFSQASLSPTQKSFMIKLRNSLCYPDCSWPTWDNSSNNTTDPCTWDWVRCSSSHSDNSSTVITVLYLYNKGLINSSFLTMACQINSLEFIDVSFNLLSSIPDEFSTSCAKLPSLGSLDFSSNSISGPLPSFNKGFTMLVSLNLSNNSLSGSIEEKLDGLTGLQNLDLHSNNFTGSIPEQIANFKNLTDIDLSYNSLVGTIPTDLLSLPNLQIVDLSHNKLVGTLPRNVSSGLHTLRMGGNLLHGSILDIDFSILENLASLELENNYLSGTIPSDLFKSQELSKLNLGGNNFFGEIPDEISKLSGLTSLNISWNSLSGSIPASISGLTNLEYLHLQGNNLSGLIPGNFDNMYNLIELQLGRNHLSGVLPSMPRHLQVLNLSNNLLEGAIPQPFDYMGYPSILDLSNNRFSGNLEDVFGKETYYNLVYLDLSGNKLSGTIPSKFGTSDLNHLNLSYNFLSGPIPFLLQDFSYEAFIGNRKLCGKPLTNDCSNDNIYPGLYISVGIGFYLGFWGVCGSLALKHSWRYAFFNFFDLIINKIYVTIAVYVAKFRRNP